GGEVLPVGGVAVVAGGGDQHRAARERVLHRLLLGRRALPGAAAAAERHADDLGAPVDGVADAPGERVVAAGPRSGPVGVGVLQCDPYRQHPGGGRDAEHPAAAVLAVAVAGGQAGHGGAVVAPAPAGPGGAGQVGAVHHGAAQVLVVAADAGVEDGHQHA